MDTASSIHRIQRERQKDEISFIRTAYFGFLCIRKREDMSVFEKTVKLVGCSRIEEKRMEIHAVEASWRAGRRGRKGN